LGQYSYEIYLTHVFVVFGLLSLFLKAGKPMILVPVYFVRTILISGFLGAAVANLYSEPMNRLLRSKLATGRAPSSTQVAYAGLQDGVASSNS
jgi:peptidoglycan/LPS O-acetylase OafA/YrhL